MSSELKTRETSNGYVFSMPYSTMYEMMDYLDELGIERNRYYFTLLPVNNSFHSVMTFTGSNDLDILIKLKYGQFSIPDRIIKGDVHSYHKYFLNGLNR